MFQVEVCVEGCVEAVVIVNILSSYAVAFGVRQLIAALSCATFEIGESGDQSPHSRGPPLVF
jgi:hypothetical protein